MKIQHGKLEYWFQTGFKQNSKCFVIFTKCAIKNFIRVQLNSLQTCLSFGVNGAKFLIGALTFWLESA